MKKNIYFAAFVCTASLLCSCVLFEPELPEGEIPVSLVGPETPEKTESGAMTLAAAESRMNGLLTTAMIRHGYSGEQVKIYVPFENPLSPSFEQLLARSGMFRISGDPESPLKLLSVMKDSSWSVVLTEQKTQKILLDKTFQITKD